MKIYTKGGDAGETSLFDQTRVSKADPRVEAYGEIDELNALLGVVLAMLTDAELRDPLVDIQRDLFAVGAMLADPRARIAARVTKAVGRRTSPGSKPGSTRSAERRRCDASFSPAARRAVPDCNVADGAAERAGAGRTRSGCLRAGPATYVNRLSDLLFVMARAQSSGGRARTGWYVATVEAAYARCRRPARDHEAFPSPRTCRTGDAAAHRRDLCVCPDGRRFRRRSASRTRTVCAT
jgi:cob(I)alamin adenosyltransferase